jgi:hypothetical protein
MSSFACLRVLTPESLSSRADLAGLVNKFASAFLESRWGFPRRFELLGPCTFLLIEPRGGDLDHGQLRDMASDLQLRLFGAEGDGEVTLVAFEGVAAEVARFAALAPEDLDHILAGEPYRPPFVGRLARITAAEVVGVPLPGSAELEAAPPRAAPARRTQTINPVFFGVYFAPKEMFVGTSVMSRDDRFNLLEGVWPTDAHEAHDYDARAVAAVGAALRTLPARGGLLFTPICYASIIHRTERERHAAFLDALPADRRGQLAAAVYDTPRQPSYSTLPLMRDFLRRYFGTIDLQVTDPDFEVESLPQGLANSVTFVLPEGDAKRRLAAIRRFSDRREAYKSRRVWPAITNVRTQTELSACFANRVPFVTGRAVTDALRWPPSTPGCAARDLPLRAA